MNKEKAKRLKEVSERAIKIIEMLEQEIPAQKIVEKLGCNRQLVDYYKNQLEF